MGRRGIITIDGPAGAGKSTVGRLLAQSLGYLYLDSGALYRVVAWQSSRLNLELADCAVLSAFLKQFRPEVAADSGNFRVLVNGRDVTGELRTPRISQEASRVAALPPVRRWVGERLRALAQDGGIVAEGRDLGSVVFPDAEVKFYLDADLAARAARRRQEWLNQALPLDLAGTMTELAQRDQQDQTRSDSPLRVPPGAVVIDTTALSPAEVVARCLEHIKSVASSNSR